MISAVASVNVEPQSEISAVAEVIYAVAGEFCAVIIVSGDCSGV
jgi:hypothetical protein